MPGVGQLRHRVDVENPARVTDGDGGYTDAYTAATPSPVWAQIEPATPRAVERLTGNTVEAPITHIVTLRTHDGITTKTRLTFNGRRFHVRGLQRVDEQTHWLRLACEEYLA